MSNAVVLDTFTICLIAAAAVLVAGILELALWVWAAKRLERKERRR